MPAAFPTFTGPLRHTAEMRTVKHVCVYGVLQSGKVEVLYGGSGVAAGYFADAGTTLPAAFAHAPTLIWLQSTAMGKKMAGTLAVDALIGYFDRAVVRNNYVWAVLADCY